VRHTTPKGEKDAVRNAPLEDLGDRPFSTSGPFTALFQAGGVHDFPRAAGHLSSSLCALYRGSRDGLRVRAWLAENERYAVYEFRGADSDRLLGELLGLGTDELLVVHAGGVIEPIKTS